MIIPVKITNARTSTVALSASPVAVALLVAAVAVVTEVTEPIPDSTDSVRLAGVMVATNEVVVAVGTTEVETGPCQFVEQLSRTPYI